VATFTLIQKAEATSGSASSFDFTSIPQTYTDLVILTSTRNVSNNYGGFYMKFNGSTINTNVDALRLGMGGTSWLNSTSKETLWNMSSGTAESFAGGIIYIPNYTSTTHDKQVYINSSQAGSSSGLAQHISSWNWGLTNAVNRIELGTFDGSFPNDIFAQHSSACLYGISKA
jgi:hypothetical protein